MPTHLNNQETIHRISQTVNQFNQQQVTTGAIWSTWVETSFTTNTTAINIVTIGNQQVWSTWNTATLSGSSLTYQHIYANWVAQQAMVQETREQAAARESRTRWNWFWQELVNVFHRAVADQAKVKAKKLLIEHLSASQQKEYEKLGFFKVEVEGVLYQIMQGRSGNVRELDKAGKPIFSYCIHPRENVPDEDTMLAQKLLLETDLPTFKRIANRSSFYN